MRSFETRCRAVAEEADRWRDADHPPRQAAVEATLEAPNRWTEHALAHALNRWMQQITREALAGWLGGEPSSASGTIAVLHGEDGPLAGLREALAVWTLGFDYVGSVPEASPSLLPAFAAGVEEQIPDLDVRQASAEEAMREADAVLAGPIDRVEAVEDVCESHGLPASRRLLRPLRYSVGLVDGHESDDERERFAEDMLLFEGQGQRRLAVLWAPVDHPPDPYLEAMARFRGLFPAHEDTPGTLQMQQAFLEARDEPHAYADGLEFLVSRGEPTPQKAGHIRWSEYKEIGDVDRWWADHETDVYAVIARRHLHDQCPDHWPMRTPGGVHIPPLDDDDGRRIAQFLRTLGLHNSQ